MGVTIWDPRIWTQIPKLTLYLRSLTSESSFPHSYNRNSGEENLHFTGWYVISISSTICQCPQSSGGTWWIKLLTSLQEAHKQQKNCDRSQLCLLNEKSLFLLSLFVKIGCFHLPLLVVKVPRPKSSVPPECSDASSYSPRGRALILVSWGDFQKTNITIEGNTF